MFNFSYKDGHRMVTVGGMICADDDTRKLEDTAGLEHTLYYRSSFNDPACELSIPRFTRKERYSWIGRCRLPTTGCQAILKSRLRTSKVTVTSIDFYRCMGNLCSDRRGSKGRSTGTRGDQRGARGGINGDAARGSTGTQLGGSTGTQLVSPVSRSPEGSTRGGVLRGRSWGDQRGRSWGDQRGRSWGDQRGRSWGDQRGRSWGDQRGRSWGDQRGRS